MKVGDKWVASENSISDRYSLSAQLGLVVLATNLALYALWAGPLKSLGWGNAGLRVGFAATLANLAGIALLWARWPMLLRLALPVGAALVGVVQVECGIDRGSPYEARMIAVYLLWQSLAAYVCATALQLVGWQLHRTELATTPHHTLRGWQLSLAKLIEATLVVALFCKSRDLFTPTPDDNLSSVWPLWSFAAALTMLVLIALASNDQAAALWRLWWFGLALVIWLKLSRHGTGCGGEIVLHAASVQIFLAAVFAAIVRRDGYWLVLK